MDPKERSMNTPSRIRPAVVAFALLAAAASHAQAPGSAAPRLQAVTIAAEVVAGSVVLPTAANGSLTMPACANCAPKSYQTTAATRYFIGERPVTIAELHAAVLKSPQGILTVSYDVKSGVVTEVSATP